VPTAVSLLGREAELDRCGSAAAAAAGGESRMLAVLGEAGIGKSALLGAIRERAESADMLVLEGRAAEHERDVPFGLAIDALDDHVAGLHPRRLESLGQDREAELAAVLPAVARHAEAAETAGAAERYRYHRALRALIELLAGERPVALLLDDVHWADDASLEWILHLVRRPVRAAHLLVIALRPVDPAPRLLDALRGAPGAEHLELGPLPDAAARELLAPVHDDALSSRLIEEAGGNPLYLRELALVAAEPGTPLPPTLMAAVQQEVAALPPASRALIDGAAVAGDPFDPELAARAAGLDEDALVPLDRLVAADLVRPTGTARGFRFRHPVVRRAVYDAAPPAWRLAAHERAAAALDERGAPTPVRAYHVEQAARPGDDAAVDLLVRAAGESADTSPATAAHWYGAALRLLPAEDAERRAGLLAPMAIALAGAGRLPEARDAFLESFELLPEDSPVRLLLLAGCVSMENVLGRHAEARQRLERALAALPAGAPLEAKAMLEAQLALAATFPADAPAMRLWSERALQTAAGSGAEPSPAMTGAALLARGLATIGALWDGDGRAARQSVERAEEEFGAALDEVIMVCPEAAWAVGQALLFLERVEASLVVMRRGLAVARAARLGHIVAPLTSLLSMALTDALQVPESKALAETAEETSRLQGLGYQLQWALWLRAGMAWVQGDTAEVRRIEAECRPMLEALGPGDIFGPIGLCNLAAYRSTEDPAGAIRDMVAAAGPELDYGDPTWSGWLLLVLVRAALAVGDVAEAERFAAVLEERATVHELPVGLTRARVARAEIALAAGDAETAAGLALEAAAEQERRRSMLDALPSRICAGRALAALGRRDEAEAELRRVAEEAERREAWRFRDEAASELRRLGVRLKAAAGRGGDELTEREREIAALVAEGRSNKQVAAALFLSEKTIEHHLSRVYGKLGVRSRTELAAAFARMP
jgi:DNA-binding CsgD family transcriptional regulator/tetratricopeptide (TPR) repeat protein